MTGNVLEIAADVDSQRYRLCKLHVTAHSVHGPLCSSARTIALVAYEEARHRKMTRFHVACIRLAYVHESSDHVQTADSIYESSDLVPRGDVKPGHLSMPSFFIGHEGDCTC